MEGKASNETQPAEAASSAALSGQAAVLDPSLQAVKAFAVPNTASQVSSKDKLTTSKDGEHKPSLALVSGAFLVLGAYAAGVVGFRYSRFMVGKEIHRGWGNYQRYSRERLEREVLERLQRTAQRNWAEREARRREASMAAEERARREMYRRYLEWERRFRGSTKTDTFAGENEPPKPQQAAPGTYYAELGVAPTASSTEIRKAYLERAKVLHPDAQHRDWQRTMHHGDCSSRVEDMTTEERNVAFQRIVEAYQVLSNPESRRKYDAGIFGSWRR
jgi:hypothetical protein